ncbi:hypothetical protein QMK19_03145 [Streptomyces sp. H10-C2]|uniref:hypothetical protein n=1 Tax=unclassified Streptomyces TaxID=2593676 RepID=UPI0024B8D4F1|nr:MULTISPECIES: hypothetical protein [unclassified Streptomyces]MDJ0342181.1 hypothetical protein [Streptomyces sp. PH10-H1]MDJ0368695.1 hypothetical protein [Streptomyces sp. H10-C2]
MSILPNEAVLIESRTARQQYGTRIDVLEKVRTIPLLPDSLHVTTEGVAAYFDVAIEAIKSLVKDNRGELEANGYDVLTGQELRSLKALCGITSQARSLALFDRRTLLNVAMLLTQSEVARQVRRYLLDSEQAIRDLETEALARRAAGGPLTWTWFEACAVIRQRYGVDWGENMLRRRLRTAGVLRQSFEPKAAHKGLFWFTGSAWEVHAHAVPELLRRAVETDRDLRAFQGIQMRLELDDTFRLSIEGGAA